MLFTRRYALGMLGAGMGMGAGMGIGLRSVPAFGQDKASRSLEGHILGNTLAIHVPAIAGLNKGLPELGYAPPELTRVDSMQVMTQSIIGRSAELGEADISSTLQASTMGADLRVIGLVYANASLVFVVNADFVEDWADLERDDVIVAVNSKGDWIHAMLNGPLTKRNVDPDKLTIVEIGGSSSRMQALLAKRVHAVPVHIDQTPDILNKGNYKILLRPWDEYTVWIAECWLVNAAWLEDEANRRLATDIVKATITSFRRTNESLEYFADSYRQFSSIKGASEKTNEELKPVWELMSKTAKAWPNDGMFDRQYFADLMPAYKSVSSFKTEPDLETLIDTSFVEQALKELDG